MNKKQTLTNIRFQSVLGGLCNWCLSTKTAAHHLNVYAPTHLNRRSVNSQTLRMILINIMIAIAVVNPYKWIS